MAIRSVRDVCNAEFQGRLSITEFVKNVSQTTTQGLWYDTSGSAGNPRAKQWFDAAPLTAQQVRQSTDGGIFHGSDVAGLGMAKYLRSLRVGCASATPLPMNLILCDYLLYYPTVDDGVTDPQNMTNADSLPRYADGRGVQMMAVTISARAGGQSFFVTYTNQDGTAGRVTPNVVQNSAAAPGTITTSSLNTASGGHPFIPLQDGDTGVRSVQSVTMNGADTGFFALVLAFPLASSVIRGNDAPYEKDLILFANEMPQVYDDAYLGFLMLPNGSASGSAIRGSAKFIWG